MYFVLRNYFEKLGTRLETSDQHIIRWQRSFRRWVTARARPLRQLRANRCKAVQSPSDSQLNDSQAGAFFATLVS